MDAVLAHTMHLLALKLLALNVQLACTSPARRSLRALPAQHHALLASTCQVHACQSSHQHALRVVLAHIRHLRVVRQAALHAQQLVVPGII